MDAGLLTLTGEEAVYYSRARTTIPEVVPKDLQPQLLSETLMCVLINKTTPEYERLAQAVGSMVLAGILIDEHGTGILDSAT